MATPSEPWVAGKGARLAEDCSLGNSAPTTGVICGKLRRNITLTLNLTYNLFLFVWSWKLGNGRQSAARFD